MDNGSSHRGQASIRRLEGTYANLRLVHLPVHASWLNQTEIYFSIVQRKVLTPNDFTDLVEVEQRLLGFQRRCQQAAARFGWRFTRADWTDSCAAWTNQPSPSKPRDGNAAKVSCACMRCGPLCHRQR